MTDVMMIIGNYPFSLRTAAYESFGRTAAYRWKKQERVGKTPAQQFLGPDSQIIRLDGYILPLFHGGLDQVDRMRDEAALGEPLTLIDGMGHVLGDWVIKSIEEKQSEFFANGAPKRIDFTVTLEEYPNETGAGQ